jgi:hypothetical protein
MARVRRFAVNAGVFGTIQTIVVSIGVVGLFAYSVHSGDMLVILPGMCIATIVPFCIKHHLVEHVDFTRQLMNIFALSGVVAPTLFRQHYSVEDFWLRFIATTLAATYISSYFWLLSDPLISRDG